ncbi:helix-turn-helix transcriptional regulator [Desulfospira joergensenii]|uniref:helix-turn-helix transcriptional regulator n=1 Tax=Desulfospira joergensenii TaxID=53329 RepID=UPI0003B72D7C|nr:AraC family transcriptional regulator [Desulfospira joergensenii]
MGSGEDGLEQETRALLFVGKILLDIFGLDPEAKAGDQDLPGNLQKIKSFLDRRFTGDIRLEDLEKICRRNKFSIIRDFSRAYDLTPHAYVLDKRINLARTLLLKDRSVADTAAECGFFDQSHFIKTFKKFTGINPAQYKNSS